MIEADPPRREHPLIRRLTPPAWLLVLGTGIALAIAYLDAPLGAPRNALRVLLDLTAAVAIAVAIRRRRPAYALPWWCFVAAAGFAVVGDALSFYYVDVARSGLPFPSAADAAYLLIQPSIGVGLYLLTRRRMPGHQVGNTIDATVVAVAAGLVAGVFLIAPYSHNAMLSELQQQVSIMYPAMDVVVLFLAMRLMLHGRVREPALRLLTLAWVLALASDLTYSYLTLNGAYRPGSFVEAGWLLTFGMFAAAAAHPRMAAVAEPVAGDDRLRRGRLAVLLLASLAPSSVLLGGEIRHGHVDLPLTAASCGALMALVVWRLVRVAGENEALRGEAARHAAHDLLVQRQTQFATMAAHELRTPLTSLRGSLSTLVGKDLPDDLRAELLTMAARQAERLERICGDLDVVVQSDSGAVPVVTGAVDVGDAVREAVASLGAGAAERTQVRVPAGLRAQADDGRLAQVVSNLVRNAVQYAPSDVTVTATEDEGTVVIEVADRGPGLDPAVAGTAFDRFGLRSPGATGGFGVGLWVVRELVTAMGGTVAYAARPGGGAVFRVTLAGAAGRTFASVG